MNFSVLVSLLGCDLILQLSIMKEEFLLLDVKKKCAVWPVIRIRRLV